MKFVVLSLFLIAVTFGELVCTDNKVYVKFIYTSKNYADEESFEIYDGATLLYTSPALEDNEVRSLEQCLASSTNLQYTIKAKDGYGDSWAAGATLQVEGIEGNIFFKNYMVQKQEETFNLSLYYAFNRNAQMKYIAGTYTGSWTEYNYDDASWTDITLGSETPVTVTGSQFLRKTFTGVANMAAYELSLKYRYGIVAYINGVEIFRDNMPAGTIAADTPAAGSYSELEEHNIIRPGNEVTAAQSVFAVEIHFINSESQNAIDFNAFLAIIASTAPTSENDNCYAYPYDISISADKGNSIPNAHDYNKQTSVYLYGSNTDPVFTYLLQGPTPFVSGVRIFPATRINYAPKNIVMEGSNSVINPEWSPILSVADLVYYENVHRVSNTYFNAGMYKNLRMSLSTSSSSMNVFEMQPVVCNIPLPTSIEFEKTSYTYFAKYEDFSIKPLLNEFANCTISPSPAAGLTFDSLTCTLSGKVMTNMASTPYTVSTTMMGINYSGTFNLEIQECTGSLINVIRTYKGSAGYETFTIKQNSNQQVILSVGVNDGQENNIQWSTLICLTSDKYTLTVNSDSLLYWQKYSFIYLNNLLDGFNDYETISRIRFDQNLGLPTEYVFNAAYAVPPYQQWNYKMGEVPANWYSSDAAGWTAAVAGTFPESSNQIQLYKKTFSVASLADMAGVVVSVKYQYGIIIYLNNHEVFRMGVTGALSTSSFSTYSMETVNYRQISLPIKTMVVGSTAAVDYITTGTNTIAVALVAMNNQQKASTFDCTVRLVAGTVESRAFDYIYVESNGVSGSFAEIMDHYCGNTFYYNSCADNFLEFALADHRHEWISSLVVGLGYTQADKHFRNFIFKAKNEDETEWTTLITVNGLTWSLVGQKNRIWLQNNKAYNQFRFENFASGNPQDCNWQVGFIDLEMYATTGSAPALSYEDTSVSIFKDIEMAEIYPNALMYRDFTVNPALPAGVRLDPYTGTISGTASIAAPATTYTISANTYTGVAMTTTISIAVEVCTGGRSLITLVARTDSSPSEGSYKVYQGKGTTGTVMYSNNGFIAANALNYGDFCLAHGLYTVEVSDTSNGWSNPGGFYLTVDVGSMVFDSSYVYNQGTTPTVVTKYFSSYLPFQIEYDDWKVYKSTETVSSSWNEINFDDSTWTVTKAAEIGTSEAVTVYIRREVNIPDVADYHVLNVHMKYAGGVVAYFNGRKVARFNLVEDFTSTTESIELHDITKFDQFHIILATSGAVTGKNVMAFEIHRPLGQSSAEPVVFDATGVFGVNDCSPVLDSYYNITGTPNTGFGSAGSNLQALFDITPLNTYSIPRSVGSYVSWSILNMEGSRFNSFAFHNVNARNNYAFSIYGKYETDEEFTTLYETVDAEFLARSRDAFPTPVAIASFRDMRFELDTTGSGVLLMSAFVQQYCKASGEGVCPGVDDYPPVGEGQISPGPCPAGYTGYAYRECAQGVFGEIKMDKCIQKLPRDLHYANDRYTFVKDIEVTIPAPTFTNIVEKFYLDENVHLPEGLVLDELTGAISGKPTVTVDLKAFTIFGENQKGVTSTEINISVRLGECKAEGKFAKTLVGETAIHECSADGAYVGTQTRACVLGAADGEWMEVEGMCILISLLVTLIVVVIIIIAIIIFIIIRISKKKKVGGVKGKKSAMKVEKTKKTAAKDVKV